MRHDFESPLGPLTLERTPKGLFISAAGQERPLNGMIEQSCEAVLGLETLRLAERVRELEAESTALAQKGSLESPS
jgi:hypothetical protein